MGRSPLIKSIWCNCVDNKGIATTWKFESALEKVVIGEKRLGRRWNVKSCF